LKHVVGPSKVSVWTVAPRAGAWIETALNVNRIRLDP